MQSISMQNIFSALAISCSITLTSGCNSISPQAIQDIATIVANDSQRSALQPEAKPDVQGNALVTPPNNETYLTHRTNIHGYEIMYPLKWTRNEAANGAFVMFRQPEVPGEFRNNFVMVAELIPQEMDLDQYTALSADTYTNPEKFQAMIQTIFGSLLPPSVLQSAQGEILAQENIELNGMKFSRIKSQIRISTIRSQSDAYATIKNGRAYTLTFSYSDFSEEAINSIRNKILGSLKLL